MTLAQFSGPLRPSELDVGQELQHVVNVEERDVGAQGASAADAVE